MSFVLCERCGHDNDAAAALCELCGAALGGRATAGVLTQAPPGYAPPAQPSAAGQAPAGTLPFDFAVRPFESAGAVIGPTFQFYREHLGAVAKIVFVGVPLQAALSLPAGEMQAEPVLPCALSWLVSAAVNSFLTGALVHAVMSLLRTGASPPLVDSLMWGLRKWWPLMLCSILSGLLFGLGSVLFCVPGIILMVIYAVALPAAAVEKLDPIQALERSASLTKGYRGLVFVTVLLSLLLTYGGAFLYAVFGRTTAGEGAQLITSLVATAVTQLIASMGTTVTIFTYLSLRSDRGEFDAPAPPAGQLP